MNINKLMSNFCGTLLKCLSMRQVCNKCFVLIVYGVYHLGNPASVAAATSPAVAPALKGGVIAVWLGGTTMEREAILRLPMVKGGQVVVQWAEVELEKGNYNFRRLDDQLTDFVKRGLPVTIQLNGNRKPHYLFNEVPYVKEGAKEVPAFRQVGDREGTLMFWHPAHERAYIACLTALRDHLLQVEYRSSIIGLRMSFNAFGTEGINIYPPVNAAEYAVKTRWIRPPGLDASLHYDGFSKTEALQYVRRIMRKHIELFSGVVPMFIRCTVDSEVLADFSEYLSNGTFGIFETGSSFAPFSTKTEEEQEWILRYCKSGKTLGYAESIGDSWGFRGGRQDTLLFSPPQVCYWRVLSDLHKGVSYLAFYGNDLNVAVTGSYRARSSPSEGGSANLEYNDRDSGFNYKEEFYEALAFADRYAGQHADPEHAPGAWIALRANDAVADAKNTRQQLKVFNSDYTFLMERLPDKSIGVTHIGPDHLRYGAYARRLPPNAVMRFRINPDFLRSLHGTGEMRIIYFDDAPGASFSASAGNRSKTVRLFGTKTWQTAVLDLGPLDIGVERDSAHVVIQNGDKPVNFHLVEIRRIVLAP